MLEQKIVVGFCLSRIRFNALKSTMNAFRPTEFANFFDVCVEVAQQDDVVFPVLCFLHSFECVLQREDFGFRFIGIGVDIDQRECERLFGRRAANAKSRNQRRAV